MSWLRQPVAMIRAYADMLPRLEAEESEEAVMQIAVGTGSMKQKDLDRVRASWRRQAAGPSAESAKPRFNLDGLAAAGVGIRVVPKA